MCLRVTRHARGHTTWQASSYTNTLSCPCPYSHSNHRMRLAIRSLHSHESGVTPAVTRIVTRRSRGHNTTINKLRIRGGFRTSSKYSVASLQRIILRAYPLFNSFSLYAVALHLLQPLLIDVLCFYCAFHVYN